MKAVVIAVPDGAPEDYSDFVAYIATQLQEGFTSGHVDREHYWSIEEMDSDLPPGYRWATAEETEQYMNGHLAGAIVVTRTADAQGKPYTQGEADIAVPLEGEQRG